jgi:hypothetical protein
MAMHQSNKQPIQMPKKMFHLNKMLECEINMDLLISEVEKHKVQLPKSAAYEKMYNGAIDAVDLDAEAVKEILIELKNKQEKLYVTDQRQIEKRFGRIKTFFIRDLIGKK